MAAAALVCSVVCVCVRVCVLAVSWPCRADRPSSHGAGSSCVLCCRSGSLSHRSVVSAASCHKQPQQQQQQKSTFFSCSFFFFFSFFPSSVSDPFCSTLTLFCSSPRDVPPHLPHSPSISFFCLPNLLFLRCFSLSSFFSSTVSMARPSLSVCLRSSSCPMDPVSIQKLSSVTLNHDAWAE